MGLFSTKEEPGILENWGSWISDLAKNIVGKTVVTATPDTAMQVDLGLPKALQYTNYPIARSLATAPYAWKDAPASAPAVNTPSAPSTTPVTKTTPAVASTPSVPATQTTSPVKIFNSRTFLPSYLRYTKPGVISDSEWFNTPSGVTDTSGNVINNASQIGENIAKGVKGFNNSGVDTDKGLWDNILTGLGNVAKTNPLSFLTTGVGIWNAFSDYQNSKKMLGMYQDQINLQREAYEKNEARNQERFNWLRDARATSQL